MPSIDYSPIIERLEEGAARSRELLGSLSRRFPDAVIMDFSRFFYGANVGSVVILHGAAFRAGLNVNGRHCFDPWSFRSLSEQGGERG